MCHYARLAIDRGKKYSQKDTDEMESKTGQSSQFMNPIADTIDFDNTVSLAPDVRIMFILTPFELIHPAACCLDLFGLHRDSFPSINVLTNDPDKF